MEIPNKNGLPVNLLSACFNSKSTTYKFYWFLSIIQSIEEGKSIIEKKELFARMVSNAWFTVNYFHISFGKQDLIQKAIKAIIDCEHIPVDAKQDFIIKKLLNTPNTITQNHLWHFNKNVPHWFLSPWFPKLQNETESQQTRRIYIESKRNTNKTLYELNEETISLYPEWKEYIFNHSKILKDFCYWNLALFLQNKNPNVPDIPNKLIKPAIRNSLTKQRIGFWDIVINKLGYIECIYTGEVLHVGNYVVDHFIPFNFVSHDLIWNLVPASPSFNSVKSDKLPIMMKHFDRFFNVQKNAIEIIRDKSPKNKFLEDYLTIFSDLDEISNLPLNFTQEKFKDRIQPLITIASNNGFEFLK